MLYFCLVLALASFSGRMLDPNGQPVAGATVRLGTVETRSGAQGMYRLDALPVIYAVTIEAPYFEAARFEVPVVELATVRDLRFEQVARRRESLVVSAKTLEPGIDLRNSEVYRALSSLATISFSSSSTPASMPASTKAAAIGGDPPLWFQSRSWRRQRWPKIELLGKRAAIGVELAVQRNYDWRSTGRRGIVDLKKGGRFSFRVLNIVAF